MKIGILGVGHIGKTLALKLSKAGHEVEVANSRDPESISAEVLETGAVAVIAKHAVVDKDVIILSIPLNRLQDIAPLLADLSEETVVIDTSNYYPHRDNRIENMEDGMVESLWVQEKLGRPVVKAWNAIGSDSFARKGKPAGSPDRIAIPIAADREHDKNVAITLINDSGLDAYYSGSLSESWRQQPGTPAYCTDLTLAELPAAIDAANAERAPKNRDLAITKMMEQVGDGLTNPDAEFVVNLARELYK